MKQKIFAKPICQLSLFLLFIVFVVFLPSCDREFVQASTDLSHVEYTYEYNPQNGTVTPKIKSPSLDEFGFNIGILFASGGGGNMGAPSSFLKNQFANTEYLASSFNNHGPSFSQNENSLLNESNYNPAKASSQNIGFMGGLEFVKKGGKGEHLYYLEIPLYATYSFHLKTNGTVFGNLGPYFSYGLGSAFGDNGGFKSFDAGASVNAGYQTVSGIRFSLAYDYGLVNIDNSGSNGGFGSPTNETAKNRSISLNVGIPFSKFVKRK